MKKELQFCFELVKANAILARRLSSHGLDFSDFMILHFLNEAENSQLRRVDLASRLGLTASGITRMLLPLEKLGIIKRNLDETDARARYATLTKAGQNLLTDATKTINEKLEDLMPADKTRQISELTKLLETINQAS